MQYDSRYDANRIRQFASQLSNLGEKDREFLKSQFDGTESADFYAGMLAAFATAYQISNQDRLIGLCVAAVSDLIESKEMLVSEPNVPD